MKADCIRVTHPCATRHQKSKLFYVTVRLACVRPAASVHPEPGSNSSSLNLKYIQQLLKKSVQVDFSSLNSYTLDFISLKIKSLSIQYINEL